MVSICVKIKIPPPLRPKALTRSSQSVGWAKDLMAVGIKSGNRLFIGLINQQPAGRFPNVEPGGLNPSNMWKLISVVARMNRRRAQLGPDPVPVVGAQILARDGARCGLLNCNAVNWLRASTSCAPVAYNGLRHANGGGKFAHAAQKVNCVIECFHTLDNHSSDLISQHQSDSQK